ncbi:hypothetical protein C4J81_08710 [Deltaproteobacteria bacterium Smac51]|nr:hypothetical protein C4J81_08710 [Deltaproteobacteria bacterium Smac51]
MDLGAFLQPGWVYSVLMEESGPKSRLINGTVRARRGRPFWSASEPLAPGQFLSLQVELEGFGLDEDDSLYPGGPDGGAIIILAGRVMSCRYFTPLKVYVFHFDLMGRILLD